MVKLESTAFDSFKMAAPGADSMKEILHATVVEILAVAEKMEATANSPFTSY